MKIKKIIARAIKDSRGEKTISIIVKTAKGKFTTSAPAGKSKGKYEVKSYSPTLVHDIQIINLLDIDKINNIINKKISIKDNFLILKDIEKLVSDRIGANTLFAFEASLLKALAKENKKELWEFIGGKKKIIKPIGNAIGGGLHSVGIKGVCPDFQEFLFIADEKSNKECVKTNNLAYKIAKKFLKNSKKNDEGAWETDLSNEQVLGVMKNVQEILKRYKKKVYIGLDVAANSFYKNKKYIYKNPVEKLSKNEQINYLSELIKKYNLFYVEDGLDENDFSGFKELKKKVNKTGCLIVGDDLTTTNPSRLKKAIKMKSINAIIIKPNQIGSLLKVRKVVKICKKKGIKTIISHRSGETKDNTIADLAIGFGVDFVKTGIYGSVRKSKLDRLIKIEKN